MKFVATQKNTRQSPRKIRMVANQVKKLSLEDCINQLAVIPRRSTIVLLKTIKQAMANAQNNHGISPAQLEIDEIRVNEGPRYKRFRAVSRGRAHGIIKRTSHVTVVLRQKTEEKDAKEKKAATAATEKTAKVEKKDSKKSTPSTKKSKKTEKKAASTKKETKKKATAKKTTKKSTKESTKK